MGVYDDFPDLPECEPVRTCDTGRTIPGSKPCGRPATRFWVRSDGTRKYVGQCARCTMTMPFYLTTRKWRPVTETELDVWEVHSS